MKLGFTLGLLVIALVLGDLPSGTGYAAETPPAEDCQFDSSKPGCGRRDMRIPVRNMLGQSSNGRTPVTDRILGFNSQASVKPS